MGWSNNPVLIIEPGYPTAASRAFTIATLASLMVLRPAWSSRRCSTFAK